jgi:predicted  nucleic acid-binding Zn-ribbon protein
MAYNGSNEPPDHPTDEWSGPGPHEKYLELAAASTAGDLTPDEQRLLREHLVVCPDCRRAFEEFEAAVDIGVPMLSSELDRSSSKKTNGLPAESFRAEVIDDRELQSAPARLLPELPGGSNAAPISQRNRHSRTHLNWNLMWLPLAAAILLTAALGIYSYRAGKGRGVEIAQANLPRLDQDAKLKLEALEQQLSDASHEHELLRTKVAERDRLISDLRDQMDAQSSTLAEMKVAQATLENSIQTSEVEKQRLLAEEREKLGRKLETAEAALQKTQNELDSLLQRRAQDEQQAASLETQLREMSRLLHDREKTIDRQEELLAHDKDIRELVGARDLYIAEVYDVDRDGSTQKPYGRVFYTRGKSLIFYAYDLDQQPGAKAATFQAWGRRGPDTQQALNLGLFYKDTVGKKRWILKFDDPKTLDQIDAVFVTLEPNGQSHKPSGKSLLFAYLKVNPNHP